jgi:hypothetical protein
VAKQGKQNICRSSMDFEKKDLDQLKNDIHSISTPIGYGSSFDKSFTIDGHIIGFKTQYF